jgi:hypothetical protein
MGLFLTVDGSVVVGAPCDDHDGFCVVAKTATADRPNG